jgi:hypothetical protein
MRQDVPHRGFDIRSVHAYDYATGNLIIVHYNCVPPSPIAISGRTPTKTDSNRRVREQYAAGYALFELTRDFGITEQRIHQIVNGA